MGFFTELATIAEGVSLTLHIKQKNGKFTLSIMPDKVDKVQPLLTTKTPEELDAELIGMLRKPLELAKEFFVNEAAYEESLKNTSSGKKLDKAKAPNTTSTEKTKPAQKKDKKEGDQAIKTGDTPSKKSADKSTRTSLPEPIPKDPAPEVPQQLTIV